MGETGGVVTAAGLVFAFTMMSMAASDLRSIGQAGTTIGLGLLFDTLVVRSLMTPSIAALLGRWFWWPQRVRPRPASYMLRPFGPRRLVRSLLLGEDADAVKRQRPFGLTCHRRRRWRVFLGPMVPTGKGRIWRHHSNHDG